MRIFLGRLQLVIDDLRVRSSMIGWAEQKETFRYLIEGFARAETAVDKSRVSHATALGSSALKCPGMEYRREPRRAERLAVSIDAMDSGGQRFMQDVVASNISNSGALLSGISKPLRSGDLLWVALGGRKSRFKVVWVRDSETTQMIQAAIHLVPTESCPWMNL